MGNNNMATPLYRRKIDENGNFLPFSGYTIVAHATHPLPPQLNDLVDNLSNSDLRHYYSFLPKSSYHVTINPLENVRPEHENLLHDEQRKLKERNTSLICTVKYLKRSKVIFMEVKFDERNENFQTLLDQIRSTELQEAKILHPYALSWHLTLAYQYKSIENDEIQHQLDRIVEELSQSCKDQLDIPLESIRICSFDDLREFRPI